MSGASSHHCFLLARPHPAITVTHPPSPTATKPDATHLARGQTSIFRFRAMNGYWFQGYIAAAAGASGIMSEHSSARGGAYTHALTPIRASHACSLNVLGGARYARANQLPLTHACPGSPSAPRNLQPLTPSPVIRSPSAAPTRRVPRRSGNSGISGTRARVTCPGPAEVSAGPGIIAGSEY